MSTQPLPPPLTPAMRDEIRRYTEDYGWEWKIVTRIINRLYGANYTSKTIENLYYHK